MKPTKEMVRERYHNDDIYRAKRLLYGKIWRQNNKEKIKFLVKERMKNARCKELARLRSAKYRAANREKVVAATHRWNALNTDKVLANMKKYKLAKDYRCPQWLTKEQNEIIKTVYSIASIYRKITGLDWEVDHELPLRGKTVSGLHVPWNLRILRKHVNRSKFNKLYIV